MNVRDAKLGDVAQFIRGVTFKPDDLVPLGSENSVACLRTKNVQTDLDLGDVWAIPETFVKNKERLCREGDIILSTANSWNLVGKASWVPALDWPTSVGGFVSLLRADEKTVVPRYLFHWITWGRTQAALRSCARQTTNISNLSISQASDLRVPLPPLEEQKRIAAILDQADALRRLRRRALDRLNTLGQAIFHEMFGDPVINERAWPREEIGSLCERVSVGVVIKPASYYVQDGIPALRGTNIKPNGIDVSDLVFFSEEAHAGPLRKSRLKAGDLISVRSGRPGLTAVVPKEFDGANAIDVLISTPKRDRINAIYLRDFLNSSGGKKIVLSEARGQIQQHFNVKSMSGARIPVPPIEAQEVYAQRLQRLDVDVSRMGVSLRLQENAFTSLQHRAFRGEL